MEKFLEILTQLLKKYGRTIALATFTVFITAAQAVSQEKLNQEAVNVICNGK